MYGATYLQATGNVGGAAGGSLHGVILTGGSDAASVTLSSGNPSTILRIGAAAGATVSLIGLDIPYAGQLVATITGTNPHITVLQ